MPLGRIQADKNFLKRCLEQIEKRDNDRDPQLQVMACNFFCIAVVGCIEQGVKELAKEYAKNRTARNLDRAIDRLCQSFQNPRPDKLFDLMDLFIEDSGASLKKDWENDGSLIPETLKGAVGNRITIAHQVNRNSNVSASTARAYFDMYEGLMRILETRFMQSNPQTPP